MYIADLINNSDALPNSPKKRSGCFEIFAHFEEIRQKGRRLILQGLGCELLLASEDSLHTVAEEGRWKERGEAAH